MALPQWARDVPISDWDRPFHESRAFFCALCLRTALLLPPAIMLPWQAALAGVAANPAITSNAPAAAIPPPRRMSRMLNIGSLPELPGVRAASALASYVAATREKVQGTSSAAGEPRA